MRRTLACLAFVGLIGSAAGCYGGRGICDCLDYRDPCCYGPYHIGPVMTMHGGPTTGPLGAPGIQAEPLKVMPKDISKEQESSNEAPAKLP